MSWHDKVRSPREIDPLRIAAVSRRVIDRRYKS